MKIVNLIARLLLGLMFVVFGLNGFLHFLPMGPLPQGVAGQYIGVLVASHIVLVVAGIQVVSGVLFLINRFVPLALVLIGPVLVNILLYHLLIQSTGFQPGALAAILWFLIFWAHRSTFAGIFQAKSQS